VLKNHWAFELNSYEDTVSIIEFKKSKDGPNPRLCVNLSKFRRHAQKFEAGIWRKRKGTFEMCHVQYTNLHLLLSLSFAKDNDGRPHCFLSLQGSRSWKCMLSGLSQQQSSLD
jgi:hypothetical protein